MRLGRQVLAGLELYRASRAGLATEPAARRKDDAVEGGRDAERHALAAADLHHLAKAAAMLAGAAGIGAVLLAPHHDRRQRLGDLDRHVAHARREGGGAEAVG